MSDINAGKEAANSLDWLRNTVKTQIGRNHHVDQNKDQEKQSGYQLIRRVQHLVIHFSRRLTMYCQFPKFLTFLLDIWSENTFGPNSVSSFDPKL